MYKSYSELGNQPEKNRDLYSVLELTTNEQKAQIINSTHIVCVDIYANWCGPCKQLMPRLMNMEANYPNVKFIKIDIDANMEYAQSLGIMSVPTILVYKGTTLVNKSIGANVDSVYKKILDTL